MTPEKQNCSKSRTTVFIGIIIRRRPIQPTQEEKGVSWATHKRMKQQQKRDLWQLIRAVWIWVVIYHSFSSIFPSVRYMDQWLSRVYNPGTLLPRCRLFPLYKPCEIPAFCPISWEDATSLSLHSNWIVPKMYLKEQRWGERSRWEEQEETQILQGQRWRLPRKPGIRMESAKSKSGSPQETESTPVSWTWKTSYKEVIVKKRGLITKGSTRGL